MLESEVRINQKEEGRDRQYDVRKASRRDARHVRDTTCETTDVGRWVIEFWFWFTSVLEGGFMYAFASVISSHPRFVLFVECRLVCSDSQWSFTDEVVSF